MLKRCWVLVLVVVVVGMSAEPASARRARQIALRRPAPEIYRKRAIPEVPPTGPYEAALLIDAETGQVLFEKDASRPRPPASMVKMMTALVAIEAVRAREINLDQPVRASLTAARTGGSRVFLRPGEVFPLDELLKAMMIASANDASVAVAEAIAGNTEAMVERMNRRAYELGMTETVYHSVNGLPPRRRGQLPDVTSANDLATLARKILDYPEILRYSAQGEARFRNGIVRLRNTNHLIGRMAGVDGLKTGYYRLAGFNLTATAMRNGMRLIAVVLGCPTQSARFDMAQDFLEWGFANYSKLDLVRAGDPLGVVVNVADGTRETLHPVAAGDVRLLVRKGEDRDLRVRFQLPGTVAAPISKDQLLGEIIVHDDHGIFDVIPAVSPLDVGRNSSLRTQAISH